MNMGNKIDIVLPWVDNTDSGWQDSFQKHRDNKGDNSASRFRDWNLLKYWFRSVEKYAPWFGQIHFITSGELPGWLNIEHPQLNWIKHQDYIPSQYLPTFSSHTIELNLHHIKELSDKFVYFNDDCFLTKPVEQSRFFKNDLPYDLGVMSAKPAGRIVAHIAINNLEVLNIHFDKHQAIKSNLCKWINLKYGTSVLNNILLYPWKEFSGFIDPHMPNAFLKETFEKVWQAAPDILKATCKNKFRTIEDVNQWLMRYWQLAEGKFVPRNIKKDTLCIDINNSTIEHICNAIENNTYEIICINDSDDITNFEEIQAKIQNSFEAILPEKSSFEI